MAGSVVERLIIEIAGDAKKYKEELKSLQKANKKGEASFKKLALVGKAGFLAVAAAATAAAVAAAKSFITFEKGVTNVAKTTNLAGQELEDFKKEIMDLSEEIPVTTDKLLEIATAAGQLGIKGTKNLVIFTETIAKLGATTDLEGENAAISIARILNLVGEGVDTVDQFGSAIVDLGNNFATSESQILAVAAEVARATVNFKLSSPQVLGLATSMSSLGIAAEAGSTVVGKAFRAIDNAIRSQAGPAFEKLIELSGMTGEELTNTFQTDATKVFESFIQGLGRAGKSGKTMSAELRQLGLSGDRVEKILPTLAERSDILSDALERSAIASKKNVALNEEAAAAFGTAASKLIKAQNKINNVMIVMGAKIAPAFADAMEDVADTVKQNQRAFTALGVLFGFLVKVISFLAVSFGLFVSDVINDLKKARQNIEDFVFFSIGAFLDLLKVSRKIFNVISGKVVEFVGILGAELTHVKKLLQEKVIKNFNVLKAVSIGVFDAVSDKVTEWVDSLRKKSEPVQQIVSNIIGIFLALGAATTKIFDAIDNKIGEFVDSFRKRITMVQGWVSSITPDLLSFGDDASKSVKKADEAVEESSKSILESIGELIVKYRDAGKEWISSDDEVTAKTSENKERRVEIQKEETDVIKEQSEKRKNAVIAMAEETRKKQEEIEAKKLASQAKLNKAELNLITAMADGKSEIEITALQARFDAIKKINDLNNEILRLQEKENLTALEQQKIDHYQNLLSIRDLSNKAEEESLDDILNKIKSGQKTREQLEKEGIIERAKLQVKEHDQRLKDEIIFGEKMAFIKSVQRSTEYQNTKSAAGELSALTNSENKNLREIGKAATIIQIGISTTEAAIKVFNGLAWIPVVGFGLGILGAAAITAYGAERINNVRQMKEGGIVPGSGRGDKIPALLEPGELVVPRDITVDIMKKLGARQMASGGTAVGAKENKDLYNTFSDMFNPATFVKSLVYEYLGWGFDGGDGAKEASGFGAEKFGGMISGMIKEGEKGAEELANILLDETPGGEYIQKIAKWAKLSDEKMKDIIKDIVGEGPLFDFLESIDSKFGGFITENIIKIGGDVGGFLYDLGGDLSDIGSGLGFQNGGIVPGTGTGDIVPAFLEPGELVIPKDLTSSLLNISQGFGSVQIPTNNQSGESSGGGEKMIVVEISMNDNAAEVINAQIREGDNLGYMNRN